MVIAWSLADFRYRFRVAIAPFALRRTSFFVIGVIGFLTLLTDLWRAEEWLVIKGAMFTPSTWQAFLGGLFLFTFLSWAWFAFIKPPVFGKRNAKRYHLTVRKIIVSGSSKELSILATELGRSYYSIIEHARELKPEPAKEPDDHSSPTKTKLTSGDYANELLLLIADKRICRHIVDSASADLIVFYETISKLEKYQIPVSIFSKNITEAALLNRDSFIYHETEGYHTGALGYEKPITQTLYGEFKRLEAIGSLLDVWPAHQRSWDSHAWEDSASADLIVFYETISKLEKYQIPVSIFSKNITEAALLNRDSFIYHETEGYHTGALGYEKPITQTLYGEFKRLEAIGSLLDVWPAHQRSWDSHAWEAYCRVTLIAIKGQIEADYWQHSYSVYIAIEHIKSACGDLYKLNGQEHVDYHDEIEQRLRIVTDFTKQCLDFLDEVEIPRWVIEEKRDRKLGGGHTILDYTASLIEELVNYASSVREPVWTCWTIQHNTVWNTFFGSLRGQGTASDIILFKVRRRLYEDLVRMNDRPDCKGGKILGMILNVSMLGNRCAKTNAREYPIFKSALNWCRKNLARVHEKNPKVLPDCLPARVNYDHDKRRLVYTFDPDAFRTEAKHIYYSVD